MLELDCHLTHDGHVVVSHDENLLRQTGHDVTMSSLNLQVSGTGLKLPRLPVVDSWREAVQQTDHTSTTC